jgi:hypothetical protein
MEQSNTYVKLAMPLPLDIAMPGITIQNVPDDLFQRLVASTSSTHHRSLAQEIVVALEHHVGKAFQDKPVLLDRIRAIRSRFHPAISSAEIEMTGRFRRAVIVVDSNRLAYVLLPAPHDSLPDAVLGQDPDWIALQWPNFATLYWVRCAGKLSRSPLPGLDTLEQRADQGRRVA